MVSLGVRQGCAILSAELIVVEDCVFGCTACGLTIYADSQEGRLLI